MRAFECLLLTYLCSGACCSAQDLGAEKDSEAPKSAVVSLEFSQPKAVQDLTAAPMVVGRFDCSDDGDIYTLIDGYAVNRESAANNTLALLAIHPDGCATSLPWHSVPG